jgi:hypothetical protein
MRLFTVQASKENLTQTLNHTKMKDYSETLIQQIDTMNAVASASNFASMPAQQNETLNVVEVVELAQIFSMKSLSLKVSPEIISKIDRTQLINHHSIWLKCHSIDSGATRKEKPYL